MNAYPTHPAVTKAIADPSNPSLCADAIDALRDLAARSYCGGDYDAYRRYQATLFDLHYGRSTTDHWLRQYLASSVYDIEDARLKVAISDDRMLDADELADRLWAQQSELSPLHHPMFQLLFEGEPTRSQVLLYLRQQWLILQFFWLQFAELAGTMERRGTSIEKLVIVYENVWDELGEGDPVQSHVYQHRERQRHLGLGAEFRQMPDFPETMDYINTRLRLMRAPSPAAALGAIFSQEATAQSYGRLHDEMLANVSIAQRHRQVYAEHATIDVSHCDDVLALAESVTVSRAEQERMLAGHQAQMLVWHAHMDQTVALLRDEPPPVGVVPSLSGHRSAQSSPDGES